jgi:hypothetical protein
VVNPFDLVVRAGTRRREQCTLGVGVVNVDVDFVELCSRASASFRTRRLLLSDQPQLSEFNAA